MKCYCINLDRDVDRRAWVEAQASAAGLVLTRVPAVLGSTLGAEELARHRAAADHAESVVLKDLSPNDLAPHDLSPGEVGCLLSHVRALRLFVESDEPHALIIEDDVHIALDARKLLADLAAEHLPAFDLIKLERRRCGRSSRGPIVGFPVSGGYTISCRSISERRRIW